MSCDDRVLPATNKQQELLIIVQEAQAGRLGFLRPGWNNVFGMVEPVQLVVFRLGEQRYALTLPSVRRVVRAVEVTPLPSAPRTVLGIIDVQGDVLPVLNLRGRLLQTEREVIPDDQFVIAQTAGRAVALVVDEVLGVIEPPQAAVIGSPQTVPGLAQLRGAVELADGLVLIQDLEKFFSLDEARALDEAMNQDEPC